MAETETMEYKHIGEIYRCLDGTDHAWNAWEYDLVPTNMKGVDHSFLTRTCERCMLVERVELGFVRAMVEAPEPTATKVTAPNVLPFTKTPA